MVSDFNWGVDYDFQLLHILCSQRKRATYDNCYRVIDLVSRSQNLELGQKKKGTFKLGHRPQAKGKK
jgi:hypothetical protein